MNKILFANAFFLKKDTKQFKEKFKPYPPLGTLYAASQINKENFNIDFFDATFSTGVDNFIDYCENSSPDILVICEDSFNYLTKMCLLHVREATFEILEYFKTKDITIIVNSSDASDEPEHYLNSGADFIIVGEVEHTLNKLVHHLVNKVEDIPNGIMYKIKDEIISMPKSSNITDLDSIKKPLWNLINFDDYEKEWRLRHDIFSINMVTSRGCPYGCTWCAKPIWGRNYYYNSPQYIVEQIKELSQLCNFEHIWFADDIFGLKEKWIEEFAEKLLDSSISISYTIQSRADLMSQKSVESLKKSGCKYVWLGVESGNQNIIDSMNKEMTLEQVYNARKLLKESKISCGFFMQLGYLNEDIKEIDDTRNLIIELLPDEIGISVSYPLPNTVFFDIVKDQLGEKRNWQESNELATVFKATFKSEFYKKIKEHLYSELADKLKNPNDTKVALIWQDKWDELLDSSSQFYT